jgi:subtilisin family serine protease
MMKMVRFLSIALLITITLGLFAASNASATPPDQMRVFVQYAPGGRGSVQRQLNANGATFHYDFEELNTFTVTVPSAALQGLSRNPNVVLIEDDVERYPVEIMESNAEVSLPNQVVPYGIDMVQARDVWDANRDGAIDTGAPTGSNRKICIIDSGFYTLHEDLQGVTVSGYNGNLPWNVDGSGHGTHVAGTIAAMNNALGVVGVTPGTVQVFVVRVFGDDGLWAYSSTLIDAAYKCRDNGANIISMSLGGSRSNVTEKNGFATLYNTNGILSIAAAGNLGTTAYSYPASYDSVVSVAAIDSSKVVADFSQYNSQVELAAPGVGVLSTVPYLDLSSVAVDSVTYAANHIEFSARGEATGALVDGGLCGSTGPWSGKVVLCQRGTYDFYVKVMNVQNSGGVAAVIYNNVAGGFLGTLGEGNSSAIVAISISQEDGLYLFNNKLGQVATVSSTYTAPASSYEYYDGTSMATPHVAAVAALVWSSKPTATNAEIRAVLQQTAQDLGTAGRDVYFGYGLVQAKAAIDALGGGSGTTAMSVKDLDGSKTIAKKNWTPKVTITVKDSNGNPLSGVKVDGKFNTTAVSCTTTAGVCSVTTTLKLTVTSVTFTVTNLTATGYVYDAAANSDPDGDSNGTSITIIK